MEKNHFRPFPGYVGVRVISVHIGHVCSCAVSGHVRLRVISSSRSYGAEKEVAGIVGVARSEILRPKLRKPGSVYRASR